ncbi:MAG: ABC transporter substrate-binding protein [Deltaproteobacteria bacterium]|nr:ABC transporter substrate-binding protein [Deltaproteobacteria bacterium]
MRRATAALLLLAAAGVRAASPPVPGVSDTEVTFCMTVPLSGPAAAWGALAVAAETWARHVNEQGGVHGRKLRVQVRDDGYNPGRAIANLHEMKDSCFAVLGTMGTAVLGAAKDQVAESGVPWIYPLGNPRIFAGMPREKLHAIFVEYPDYADEGEFLAQQAAALEGAKRIAFFGQNDDYGKTGLEGVKRGVAGLPGVTLAGAALYEVTDREMGTHALRLKETGADAVVLYATSAHAAGLVKEMAKLAYRPRLFASFTLSDRDRMFGLLADLWEGAYYDTHLAQRGEPAADRVLETLLRLEPSLQGREGTAIHGAMVMMVAVEGLRRAGRDLDRERLVQALESLRAWSPAGLTAPVTFGPGRRHGLNGVRLLRAGKAADRSFTRVGADLLFPPLF